LARSSSAFHEKLTQNVGEELKLCTTKYLRRAQISHDDLALQALVWLLSAKFKEKTSSCIWVNKVIFFICGTVTALSSDIRIAAVS
jgi:hypothetical protein